MKPNVDQPSKSNVVAEQKMTPRELFDAIMRQWKLILLSLTVCLGIGVLYIAWKPFTFDREAQVEIKSDSDNGSSPAALSMFADLGIGQGSNNLYNEMAYFESPDLMEQVVDRLGLLTNYYMRKGLRSGVLYGSNLPVAVTFETLPKTVGGSFKMKINENEQIFLSKFVVKDKKQKFEQKNPIRFGETVMTPLGKIKIEKTPFYGKDKEEGDDKGYKISVSRNSMKGCVKIWLSKLSVNELRKEAAVINLSIDDGSAVRAEDVLNTMIEIYNEDWIKSKNDVALSSSDFIDDRLESLSKELNEVDSEIADYKTENMIPDIWGQAALNVEEEQKLRNILLDLTNQLQMTQNLKDFIEKNDSPDKTYPGNIGPQGSLLDAQIAAHNEVVLNRNAALSKSSLENPVVVSLDAQIADSKKAILTTIDTQIKFIKKQIDNANKQKLTYEKDLTATPNRARYLISVERTRKVKENLYLYLLEKKEETQLNQAFSAYNTRIIARPHGDSEPSSPNPATTLALAFILGLAIPVGTIYFREVSNTKVRDKNDLKGLSIPFLGEVPKVNTRKYDDKNHMIVVNPGKRDVVNEAFRVVRTNLGFMAEGEGKCPVVMVTSFNPGSGKSFIAINLAMSFAIRGKRVLVIDGDMRRNSSSEFIGNPDNGLAQCLLGKVKNVEDAIVKGILQENLDILPGGKTPPNPTELLENGRLAGIIAELKDKYDLIFIDSAPIQMIADGRIFSTVCTNTVFVMRAGLFERGLLTELENVYRSKEYRNMALLLNGIDASASYGNYGISKSYYAQ